MRRCCASTRFIIRSRSFRRPSRAFNTSITRWRPATISCDRIVFCWKGRADRVRPGAPSEFLGEIPLLRRTGWNGVRILQRRQADCRRVALSRTSISVGTKGVLSVGSKAGHCRVSRRLSCPMSPNCQCSAPPRLKLRGQFPRRNRALTGFLLFSRRLRSASGQERERRPRRRPASHGAGVPQ